MREHVLIAGGSGVVGYAALRHFAKDADVTVVSRRPPPELFGARFVKVDLTDEEACREVFAGMTGVTRLVYAALHEQAQLVAGWREQEQIDTNDRMLRNLLEPLPAVTLRHVTLLQGTKAYGAHVRFIPTPAREERDEYREVANFYWSQEDYLRARQASGAGWAFTIFRPQFIFGDAFGLPMAFIPALGVYAAVLRERGEPLYYPGGPPVVLEATDADLLARAIDWAGGAAEAANRAFNITNGDVFNWLDLWPALADALGMSPGPARPTSLAATMPACAAEWDAIRARYELASPALDAFVGGSFQYADLALMYTGDPPAAPLPPAILVSTVRLRQAGFVETLDTEVMFRKWFAVLQERKLLPPARREPQRRQPSAADDFNRWSRRR